MRELFLVRLIELIDKDPVKLEIFSKQKYDLLIDDVRKAKCKFFKEPADNFLLQNFNVIIENNVRKLVKPSNAFNGFKYYIYQEELFDIIYNTHNDMGHASCPELMNVLSLKYVDIPLDVIELGLSFCQVCSSANNRVNEVSDIKPYIQKIQVTQQDNWLSNSAKHPQDGSCEKQITVIDLLEDDDDENENVYNIKAGDKNSSVNNNNDKAVDIGGEAGVLSSVNKISIENSHPVMPTPLLSSKSTISCSNLSSMGNIDSPLANSTSFDKEQYVPELSQDVSDPVEIEDEDVIEVEGPTEVSLRWNLYDSNMKSVLYNFLNEEQFVDVTLACENKSINCHKVILSASSPYFEKLFRQSTNRHPILFMKDLYFWEVEALVEFMYKGEVVVSRQKLESLLDAAEALQIKGLAQPVTDMSTKNCSLRKKMFKRTNGLISHNQEKSSVKNIKNLNISKLSLKEAVDKSEIGSQTTPVLNSEQQTNYGNKNNQVSNFLANTSQNSDMFPNVYTVFTQTYIPVTNPSNTLNLIPVNNSSCSQLSCPQLSQPLVPECQTSQYTRYTPSCVSDTSVSFTSNRCRSPFSQSTITVSCNSYTQTSPSREEDEVESGNDAFNNSIKKQKILDFNEEVNNESLSNNTDVSCKSKSKNKVTKGCRKKSGNVAIKEKINTLIRTGNTNIVFTRRKTADMESIACRTRKKQSEGVRKRKLKIYDDI